MNTDPQIDESTLEFIQPRRHSRRRMVMWISLIGVGLGMGWIANELRLEQNRQEEITSDREQRRQRLNQSGKMDEVDLTANVHPLDRVLLLARKSLHHINEDIKDYTAILQRQERIGDVLLPPSKLAVKVRNVRPQQPLSIYILFQEPANVKGREVIWVQGKDDNKITAHEGGILKSIVGRIHQPYDGFLAMFGSRYSIAETGIQRMMETLIEYGLNDRNYDECQVQVTDVQSAGVSCQRIRIVHPKVRDHFMFHIAEVDLDVERNIPVRIATWLWPAEENGAPLLAEEYVYSNIKLNVGLRDADFDPDNEEYDYPEP